MNKHTSPRHPEKQRFCDHCGDGYTYRASHSMYCAECVPRNENQVIWNRRIRWYGVSKKDWDKLYQKINGICPICELRPATVVEHDHLTGKVRGLVCTRCNAGLGYLDNKEWFEKAKLFIKGEL